METNTLTLEKPQIKKVDSAIVKKVRRRSREIIAVVFWLYTIIKLLYSILISFLQEVFFQEMTGLLNSSFSYLLALLQFFG
jgi:hypothetical protein